MVVTSQSSTPHCQYSSGEIKFSTQPCFRLFGRHYEIWNQTAVHTCLVLNAHCHSVFAWKYFQLSVLRYCPYRALSI